MRFDAGPRKISAASVRSRRNKCGRVRRSIIVAVDDDDGASFSERTAAGKRGPRAFRSRTWTRTRTNPAGNRRTFQKGRPLHPLLVGRRAGGQAVPVVFSSVFRSAIGSDEGMPTFEVDTVSNSNLGRLWFTVVVRFDEPHVVIWNVKRVTTLRFRWRSPSLGRVRRKLKRENGSICPLLLVFKEMRFVVKKSHRRRGWWWRWRFIISTTNDKSAKRKHQELFWVCDCQKCFTQYQLGKTKKLTFYQINMYYLLPHYKPSTIEL